ncbi:molybdate ABC transporter permease subunit [Thalassospira sp. MA62]|nr:molybdate ABC transporter permease subunit [Thalassospira sp. MA62]
MSFDWTPVFLSIKLATTTTFALLVLATPIAWKLARMRHWIKLPLASLVAIPLVLPPTVLGFYLLLFLGPRGPAGQLADFLGLGTIPFSFTGLVIASVVYSMPFAVQPLQNAFENLGDRPLEVAATLRASPLDRFFHVVIPITRSGFLSAAVLVFAHTIGEFGVILMIGGNIPGETKVVSTAIYDHVETLEYDQAHLLSGGMVAFAFVVLLTLHFVNAQSARKDAK